MSDGSVRRQDARSGPGEGRTAVFKKATPRDDAAIAASEATIRELVKQPREATSKADDIENAVYDLKAVNPHRKAEVDRRSQPS